MGVSQNGGTPSYHPYFSGTFHDINHPFGGAPMAMETHAMPSCYGVKGSGQHGHRHWVPLVGHQLIPPGKWAFHPKTGDFLRILRWFYQFLPVTSSFLSGLFLASLDPFFSSVCFKCLPVFTGKDLKFHVTSMRQSMDWFSEKNGSKIVFFFFPRDFGMIQTRIKHTYCNAKQNETSYWPIT